MLFLNLIHSIVKSKLNTDISNESNDSLPVYTKGINPPVLKYLDCLHIVECKFRIFAFSLMIDINLKFHFSDIFHEFVIRMVLFFQKCIENYASHFLCQIWIELLCYWLISTLKIFWSWNTTYRIILTKNYIRDWRNTSGNSACLGNW